jgi:cell division septation protein DedD
MKKQVSILKNIILLSILFFPFTIFAQDDEVVEQLKIIEKGKIEEAQKALTGLKAKYPGNPSVIFLDAILKSNGEEALLLYKSVYEKNPKSTFADASLYRMFSYYYSLGLYKKAEETLSKLKAEYPKSPYIQAADRTIPEEIPSETKNVTEEKAAENKPEKPVIDESTKFTVQAGAFLNINNAQALKKNLIADGYPSEITNKEVGGSILNVVISGKFETEKGADSLLLHLDKKYKIKGRVVPIK